MNYDKILTAMSPCGLSCEKCFAHEDGDIRKYSLKLKEKLGNFDNYAKRFASENCKGCRKENCKLFKNCGVRSCHQQKNIDFCFQCDDFPCNKTNFDGDLQKRWVKLNERIRDIGIESYYAETKDKPRY